MSSTIHLQRKDAAAAGRFRTGVSLHSHTLHSRESLDFIYQAAKRAPLLSAAIRHGEGVYRRRHGAALDLSRGWWTPPLGPQVLDECRGTPISAEWTVPFGPTFFHLGVHNLPAARARALWTEMDSYRHNPHEARLREILTALAGIPQVLIIFNHPLWDEPGIGQAAHRAVALEFPRQFGSSLHALLNLTNTETSDEFAEEVRAGWSSVFVLRHYRQPYALRIFHNMMDVLRTYERHANGWRLWSDRVFYLWHDRTTRSLTESFGERTPTAVALYVGALKEAFDGAEEVTL